MKIKAFFQRLKGFTGRAPVLYRGFKRGIKCGVLMALISLFIPNKYVSEASALPTDQSGNLLGSLAGIGAAIGVNLPSGSDPDQNYPDILQSRWLVEQLLNTQFEFHDSWWYFGTPASKKETLYAYLNKADMDKAVIKMGDVFSAARDPKSNLLTFSMETTSPELSQEVVQKAVMLLNQFLTEKSMTKGRAQALFTKDRLAEGRQDMGKAEQDFLRFLEVNRNFQSSADPSVMLEGQRLEAELQLRRQLVSTMALNYETALQQEKNDLPILNMLDGGNLPIEKSKPPRSIIVLAVIFLVTLGSWLWTHRVAIGERFKEDEALDA